MFHLEISVITDLRARRVRTKEPRPNMWNINVSLNLSVVVGYLHVIWVVFQKPEWLWKQNCRQCRRLSWRGGRGRRRIAPWGPRGLSSQGKALKKWKITKYISSFHIITACIGCSQSQACWHLQALRSLPRSTRTRLRDEIRYPSLKSY